jgi:hypothetical protein
MTLIFLPDSHWLKWGGGGRAEWTSIGNSLEERTATFCKDLDGKLLFNMLYCMCAVTLNELKAIFNVSAQAGQSGPQ